MSRLFRILLDPDPVDDFATGGIIPDAAPASPDPSPTEPISSAPAPSEAAPTDTSTPQDGLLSVSDAIRQLGVTLPDDVYSQGDHATLRALAEQARQAQHYQEML